MIKSSFLLTLIFAQCFLICKGSDLVPYKVGAKWGFINNSGNVIVEAIYDCVSPFNEGYSVVKLENQYAVLNTRGEFIIPFSKRILYGFFNGLCRFSLNGKEGFINEKDSIIIQPIYDYAGDCKNNFVIVGFKNNHNYKCTYYYSILYHQTNQLIKLKHNDPYCTINNENTFKPPFLLNNRIYIAIYDKKHKIKYDVFDTLGNKVSSGLRLSDSCNGVILTKQINYSKSSFEILYGINSINNKVLVKPKFIKLTCIGNGIFIAQIKGEKELYLISANGEKVISDGFDSVHWNVSLGKGFVYKQSKWFIIDKKGSYLPIPDNVLLNFSYYKDKKCYFNLQTTNLIPVIININENAFINYDGKIINVNNDSF